MRLFALDDRREILVVNSEQGGAIFAAIRFEVLAQQSISNHGFFAVAISGGSTPKKLFEELLKPERAYKINWSRVKIFWSDERVVPEDHPDSNYGMAMHYFSKEPLDEAIKFKMPVDNKDLHQGALDYENKIKKECFSGRFDLVLLGMGDDGHTASLFPHTEALKITDRLVAENYVPQKNTWRMTLTYPCINESRKIILMTYGKAKGEALQKVFAPDADPDEYPTAKVGKSDAPALFIIDEAACAELTNLTINQP